MPAIGQQLELGLLIADQGHQGLRRFLRSEEIQQNFLPWASLQCDQSNLLDGMVPRCGRVAGRRTAKEGLIGMVLSFPLSFHRIRLADLEREG